MLNLIRRHLGVARQSGQAIIIVLLIVVVALTIGLSVTSRSVQDIKISTRTEESQRAFSAAEAGLEAALKANNSIGTTNIGSNSDISYTVSVDNSGGSDKYKLPNQPEKDDTQQVWLVSHDPTTLDIRPCDGTNTGANACYTGSSIGVCWGGDSSNQANDAALEVSIIYKESSVYKIEKFAFDPVIHGNNFTPVYRTVNIGPCPGTTYYYNQVINLPISPSSINASNENTAIRMRFLYSGKFDLGVYSSSSPTSNFPLQGKKFVSEGSAVSGNDKQTEVRRIEFTKTYPSLPSIFDFALFSNTDITK